MNGDLFTHPSQQGDLQLLDQFLGIENLGLILFQLRGDITLAVGERLLANVVLRHRFEMRLGHFNVITEDPVVSHFQRLDSCATSLSSFEMSFPFFSMRSHAPNLIELRIKTSSNKTALFDR